MLTLILFVSGFAACMSIFVLAHVLRIEKKLDALDRVGVLMTSDKEAGVAPRPMTPREKIRFLERRMNGTLSATA